MWLILNRSSFVQYILVYSVQFQSSTHRRNLVWFYHCQTKLNISWVMSRVWLEDQWNNIRVASTCEPPYYCWLLFSHQFFRVWSSDKVFVKALSNTSFLVSLPGERKSKRPRHECLICSGFSCNLCDLSMCTLNIFFVSKVSADWSNLKGTSPV